MLYDCRRMYRFLAYIVNTKVNTVRVQKWTFEKGMRQRLKVSTLASPKICSDGCSQESLMLEWMFLHSPIFSLLPHKDFFKNIQSKSILADQSCLVNSKLHLWKSWIFQKDRCFPIELLQLSIRSFSYSKSLLKTRAFKKMHWGSTSRCFLVRDAS